MFDGREDDDLNGVDSAEVSLKNEIQDDFLDGRYRRQLLRLVWVGHQKRLHHSQIILHHSTVYDN